MRVVVEHHTYEQRGDEWIEVDATRQPRRFLHRFADLAKTALALAALTAIGLVAASLALILLPVAFFASWWMRAASRTEIRRPR